MKKYLIAAGIGIGAIIGFGAITGVTFFAGTYPIIHNLIYGILSVEVFVAILLALGSTKTKEN
jgi:hypothetical protein